MYSIRLEKYKNKNQKHICPDCCHRTLVPYYDYENNCYINENIVGRCDREIECGYHYSYIKYFEDYPDKRKKDYSNRTFVHQHKSTRGTNRTNNTPETQSKIHTFSFNYIEKAIANRHNSLIKFLMLYFDEEKIKKAIAPYFIGSTKDQRIVYPQIDAAGKVRTAKIMAYDPATGRRIKDGMNAFDWMHSILIKKGYLSENYELETCLFGEHLIRSENNNDKVIVIVESEKSALLAAIYEPQYLWMASGGLNFLNLDKLKPLKDRKIILYPDTDTNKIAFDKWTKIANEAQQMGFDISVSTLLDRICTPEQKAMGYDLGDFIIDDVKNQKAEILQPTEIKPQNDTLTDINTGNESLNAMIKQNPAMMDFINKFDLVLTQNI